jgi:hypothetical protein
METLAPFGAGAAYSLVREYEVVERHNTYLTETATLGLKVIDHPPT